MEINRNNLGADDSPGAHFSVQELRSPKAAAIAGILFAALFTTSYVLIIRSAPAFSADTGDWLTEGHETVSLALSLLPFAGIAFLWFMAVVRDRLGHLEDQFFSTLFFGSGLLYLAMTFFAAAIYGGLLGLIERVPGILIEENLYIATRSLVHKITSVYMIRMAGMFMLVLGTIWKRTRLMPRWLIISTYVLALILLLSSNYSPWLTLIFPFWVLLVSIYILYLNYRHPGNIEGLSDGMTPEDQCE
jgi:hypothetical protein